jgi:hypothetical protein
MLSVTSRGVLICWWYLPFSAISAGVSMATRTTSARVSARWTSSDSPAAAISGLVR